MPNFPPIPYSSEPSVDYPPIDTSSPDDQRVSFRGTDYESILPHIRSRYPNIDPLYLTKIFRGTIRSEGLVWLDVDREDATPPDFRNLGHLLYCFEIYGQILCILVSAQGMAKELELQHGLAEYRIRLLKLSKLATWESLREWHKVNVDTMLREGQDRVEGWANQREVWGPGSVLKRKMFEDEMGEQGFDAPRKSHSSGGGSQSDAVRMAGLNVQPHQFGNRP